MRVTSSHDAGLSRFDAAAFRREYGAFLADPSRILLTGHSHQAWPDAAKTGLVRAFEDAAKYVDDKWEHAVFPLADRLGRRVLARLGMGEEDAITFASSTHDLVFRLLSALPANARVVTTTSEFHSLHRQLRRLEEDGLRVTWVEGTPRQSLAERLVAAVEPGVDLVAVSAVFFEDAYVLPDLAALAAASERAGAHLLVDAYHGFNVVPLELPESAFVVAGGYKYAQLGEGVCFMRSPAGTTLRPRSTGWFADFGSLDALRGGTTARVGYGAGGARFAGATFDPTSLYRADAVLDVFDRHGLDVPALRAINAAQTARIASALTAAGIELVSPADPTRRGGFVAARVAKASAVVARLRARNVFTDSRGDSLRLGPAPYLVEDELDRGVAAAIEEIRS